MPAKKKRAKKKVAKKKAKRKKATPKQARDSQSTSLRADNWRDTALDPEEARTPRSLACALLWQRKHTDEQVLAQVVKVFGTGKGSKRVAKRRTGKAIGLADIARWRNRINAGRLKRMQRPPTPLIKIEAKRPRARRKQVRKRAA
jgi:hypothetical protein